MEKKEYVVTKLAGRSIAGQRNPGLGGSIWLTENQAEHLERVGQIEPAGKKAAEPVVEPEADPVEDAASDEAKPRSRRRRKSDGGD